ncbi:hypothetical protein AN641_03415 [Candidatus Epulonipiscioides gigas]|nr:hypothetical protein AN641_03415 [Epulopiscium sp. SCG-C07WGA-EpuloA2]
MKSGEFLFLSGSISVMYLFSLFTDFFVATTIPSEPLAVKEMIYGAVMLPHTIFVASSVIFTWVGFFTKSKQIVLSSCILYFISLLLMSFNIHNIIFQFIFNCIAFYKMQFNNKQKIY